MKVLLAPDKFKGSLSAREVCEAMAKGMISFDSSIEAISHPLADGGEGTLDLLEVALHLEKVWVEVCDPLLRPVNAHYLMGGDVAFIEMAQASGLQLLQEPERNPLNTSTYGSGQLIRHAIESGAKKVYLFIGGSATNDGGIGMACALGGIFRSSDGVLQKPNGKQLQHLLKVDTRAMDECLKEVEFNVLCDVENPLYGVNGAAYVYGGQKGADDHEILELDEGLKHLSGILNNGFEKIPGAGAAGGLGYGAMSFLNARLKSGVAFIMETTGFYEQLAVADLVITGEGKVDLQSLQGKVVSGVLKVAKNTNIPVAIIAGQIENQDQVIDAWTPAGLISLVSDRVTLEESMHQTKKLLIQATFDLMRDLKNSF